ncbi:23180_t:CDS:2, partial [Dentiscutata erythropus]
VNRLTFNLHKLPPSVKEPSLIFSESSKPKTVWKTPISKTLNTGQLVNKGIEKMNNELDNIVLKENIKFGNKEARKCMSKKVLQYLQSFFLADNIVSANQYFSEDMYIAFKDLAINKELTLKEVLMAKTIKGWIGRYSASFKK